MTPASKSYFLDIPDRLRSLSADAIPAWGMMTPQHMVEHLVGTWRISNGRARIGSPLSEDEIQRRRKFLFSDQPYERNITNPIQGVGLQKLRKPSLSDAVDQLEDEMKEFFKYHEANPNSIEVHPVFGELDYDGWLIFQKKHMDHHLAQFGL